MKRRGNTMVRVLVIAAFVAMGLGAWHFTSSASGGVWLEDTEAALAEAERTGQPMLFLFTADW